MTSKPSGKDARTAIDVPSRGRPDRTEIAVPQFGVTLPVASTGQVPEGAATIPTFVPLQIDPGTRLNQFEVIRELGRGGMGQVFLARDIKLARLVALKFLGFPHDHITDRFLIEARATARCHHENIVLIYEAGEWQGKPYMALEYLEGQPLSEVIGGRVLPTERTIELIVQVVRALVRAHEMAIVHCDLKPENIYLTSDGVVKVLDFGIATLFDSARTAAHQVSGTPAYMAPEQWGADDIDHRADLWAVGIILWEMLTARHPLEPISIERCMGAAARLDEPVPRIAVHRPDLPAGLDAIIDRCLAKRKAQRFATARELLDELEPYLPGRLGRRLDEGENPYPGMTAFQETDADRFFGRSRDITQMIARITDHALVGVVAPSGAGKSSLVRAGLIPALRASGEPWEVFVTRPARSPLASLAQALEPITKGDDLVERMRTEPGTLGTVLRDRARQQDTKILLFVDQFEELYTLCADADERRAFAACLAGVADDPASPLRVVVSMRSDFLDRAAEHRTFMDRLTRGLVFLPPMDGAGIREALVEPLAMVGYRFESDATVDDMLGALADAPGALPLLQFTASMLWDARDREQRMLGAASYQAIGGVAGALATHADHVLAAMPPERQKLARAVMLRLVTSEGTRAIVDLAELTALAADPSDARALLDQLVAARLLIVQAREDGPVVEIVHESLITRWPTLRRWIEESAEDAAFVEQLRAAAKQWEARGRASGLLWTGEAAEDARLFTRRFAGTLPAREQQFLGAVLDLLGRAARRRRRVVAAALVILTGLVAAGAVALVWIRNAEQVAQEQREVAERATARAQEALATESKQRATIETQLRTIQEKDAERKRAESARHAAEAAKTQVESSLDVAKTEVAQSREELEAANQQLRRALAEARQDKTRAETATTKAEVAATELKKALDREKARVKQLEEAKRKLATELPP
jgi:hypothetical protein